MCRPAPEQLEDRITPDSTTTAINGFTPSTPSYGQQVTVTATVTPGTSGGPAFTGGVEFYDGATDLGPATSITSGVATITVPSSMGGANPLPGGDNYISAVFAGDANYTGSTSSPSPSSDVYVTTASTTTSLSLSYALADYGENTDLTATVTPAGAAFAYNPTGTVNFTVGSTSGPLVGSVNFDGTAQTESVTVYDLPVGTDAIYAEYQTDGNFGSSNSTTPASETVAKATTAVTLAATGGYTYYSVAGQSVSLYGVATGTSGSISGAYAPAAPSDGSVVFLVDSTPITLSPTPSYSTATNTATWTWSYAGLHTGNHTLSFSYPGDGNYNSNSGTLSFTVYSGVTVSDASGNSYQAAVVYLSPQYSDSYITDFTVSQAQPQHRRQSGARRDRVGINHAIRYCHRRRLRQFSLHAERKL